jgi:hypothetical protein
MNAWLEPLVVAAAPETTCSAQAKSSSCAERSASRWNEDDIADVRDFVHGFQLRGGRTQA